MKKIIYYILSLFLLLNLCACHLSFSNSLSNNKYLTSTDSVSISTNDYYYVFKPKEYKKGIIFYPKAGIEAESYAELLNKLAQKGYITFLAKGYKINNKDVAGVALASYDEVENWYIGCHSSGASAATLYLNDNHEKFDGLFLLAAYSDIDLSDKNLNIISIYGSNDTVLDLETYKLKLSNLGTNAKEYIIDDGTHSSFHYSSNDNSNKTIKSKQIDKTISYIISLTEIKKPNKPPVLPNVPTEYSISYETNGHGEQPNNLTNQTKLPNQLPTLTDDDWEFKGWYYDNNFTKPAYSGDIISSNTILYAKWSQITFTISFDKNGHGVLTTKDIKTTEIPNGLPILEETGWVFEGWYLDNEFKKQVIPGESISTDITIYAKWSQKLYFVSYITNGHGTQPDNLTKVNKLPTQLPILEDSEWKFEGWYLDSELTKPAIPDITISSNTILYAKWSEKYYSVIYNINGHGEQPNSLNNKSNLPSELPILEETGWVFEGWYLDENLTTPATAGLSISSNTTLYAKWSKKTYSLTYNTNGHGIQPNNLSKITKLPDQLPVLEETGWIFSGWYYDDNYTKLASNGDIINNNTILYAKWSLQTYTITYITNGHGIKPSDLTNVTTLPNPLPILEDEGWVFEGWYLDSNFKTFANYGMAISSNTTLYAKWSLKSYSVTYITNGHGEQPDNITQITKLPNSLPILDEDGWIFNGWYLDINLTKPATPGMEISSNTILYAKWSQKTYSVTYITNGHGSQPNNLSKATKLPNPLPKLSEDGWIFDGWYYDTEFSIPAKANDSLYENTVIYAKWTKVYTPTNPIDYMYSSNSNEVIVNDNIITLVNEQTASIDSLGKGTYITIPVSDVDISSVYVSIKYRATNITGLGLHAKVDQQTTKYSAQIISKGWNVTNEDCGNNVIISTAKITSYLEEYTSLDAVIIKLIGSNGATLEILDFIITTDGIHGFSVTSTNEFTYEDFVAPADGSIKINYNSKNEQIITYSKCPSWNPLESIVYNYNTDYSIIELKYSSTHDFELIFGTKVSKLGEEYTEIKKYPAGNNQIILVDLSNVIIDDNFTLVMYIDPLTNVNNTKNITIHSYRIVDPNEIDIQPEPTPNPGDYQYNIKYTESIETFANPDRGFYYPIGVEATETGINANYRQSEIYNNALIHLRIDIGAFSKDFNQYQDIELTNAMLNALDEFFAMLNNAGCCVFVRFAYTYDDIKNIEPEISMILRHIEQFTPLINKHKNMITAVECGLVGPWGEMHSSEIANQNTYNQLFAKYLSCLDKDIILLVRRPVFIYEYYGLTLDTLYKFDFENNRIACYNDGYLGSSTDLGTYVDRNKEVTFLTKINQTKPYGGEVVRPDEENTWNHLNNACDEMFKLNLSYLNIQWNDKVIERWQNTNYTLNDPLYQGQTEFTYITNHMGYRFVCEELNYSISNTLDINLRMKNVGFGELYKTKKTFIILKNNNKQYVFEYEYNNELEITKQIDISSVTNGNYELYIVLADEFNNSSVRGIRFANTDMYNETLKANKLANITIK